MMSVGNIKPKITAIHIYFQNIFFLIFFFKYLSRKQKLLCFYVKVFIIKLISSEFA